MLQQLHLAAQYLAAAGISFLDKKADDSHTNLGFSTTQKRLETWPLDANGQMLALNYENFALEWTSQNLVLSLAGKTHAEVVQWLVQSAQELGLKGQYTFDLHYKLPYGLGPEETFGNPDGKRIQELITLRSMAQEAISEFLWDEGLSSEIRIWPHHFDTGAFTALNDGSGKSIGLGLAIPDTIVDDLYFYISGYRGHNSLNTWAFKALTRGKWVNDGFKGAVWAASGATLSEAVDFFKEALAAYKR